MFILSEYQESMSLGVWKVFHSAVHHVCVNDYNAEQLAVWSSSDVDLQKWNAKIKALSPFVILKENQVVGYADVQENGYIDHFFVHADFQSKGVGNILMTALLNKSKHLNRLYSHVSITAKSFFSHYGFSVVANNSAIIRGVKLDNFIMEKVQNPHIPP